MERARFSGFTPRHQKFMYTDREYTQQYSHLYYTRLAELQRGLAAACLQKWKAANLKVVRILDVAPGVPCICVGTLYKDMALKPNFLFDYHQHVEHGEAGDDDDDDDGSVAGEAPVELGTYHSVGDVLILEDESGRMTLEGTALPPQLVTGLVIGVKGMWNRDGNFEVEDVCVSGIPPQAPPPSPSPTPSAGPTYLALVSGLNVGGPKFNPLAIQLMLDFVRGSIGDPSLTRRIARVVVAGNSLHPTEDIKSKDKIQLHTQQPESSTLVEPMRELDCYLAEVAGSCPVDIMPGDSDPSNCFLPQQPLHPCLLPRTSRCPLAAFTPNPYEVVINGLTVLGTSGQNIEDIGKYASFGSPLDILQHTLQWRNLAPTAPDTLSVYPFLNRDPFTIEECPAVYFAGNQSAFSTRLLEGPEGQRCRLVCVPSFAERPSLVLVDLQSPDLTATPVDFGTLGPCPA